MDFNDFFKFDYALIWYNHFELDIQWTTAQDYYAVLDFECTCDSSTTERTGIVGCSACLLFEANLPKSTLDQEVQT